MLYNLFENRDFVSVFAVALLAEGVDRNSSATVMSCNWLGVALLAEGVDRNLAENFQFLHVRRSPSSRRAWIEIRSCAHTHSAQFSSPSSRRAWIEISTAPATRPLCTVALLAEGVDRNYLEWVRKCRSRKSPSSRRAWIEIGWSSGSTSLVQVALLAEGVDRNKMGQNARAREDCRPPRGGRG